MDEKFSNQHKELSLVDIWDMFLKHIKTIVIISTIIFVFIFVYTWFLITPDYISSADVMVQVEQDNSSSNDNNFDLVNAFRLIDTVAELMKKEIVLDNALQKLELLGYEDLNIKYLREGLLVSSSQTSYFINISFIDENTQLAKDAVDAIIDSVIEETNVEDAFPVLTNKIRRTSYSSEASYNSPNRLLSIVLAVFIAGLFSVSYVFIKEMFSTQFRNKEEVESLTKIQVLAVIPKMDWKEKKNV